METNEKSNNTADEEKEKTPTETITYLGFTLIKATITLIALLFYLIIVPIPYFFIEGSNKKKY